MAQPTPIAHLSQGIVFGPSPVPPVSRNLHPRPAPQPPTPPPAAQPVTVAQPSNMHPTPQSSPEPHQSPEPTGLATTGSVNGVTSSIVIFSGNPDDWQPFGALRQWLSGVQVLVSTLQSMRQLSPSHDAQIIARASEQSNVNDYVRCLRAYSINPWPITEDKATLFLVCILPDSSWAKHVLFRVVERPNLPSLRPSGTADSILDDLQAIDRYHQAFFGRGLSSSRQRGVLAELRVLLTGMTFRDMASQRKRLPAAPRPAATATNERAPALPVVEESLPWGQTPKVMQMALKSTTVVARLRHERFDHALDQHALQRFPLRLLATPPQSQADVTLREHILVFKSYFDFLQDLDIAPMPINESKAIFFLARLIPGECSQLLARTLPNKGVKGTLPGISSPADLATIANMLLEVNRAALRDWPVRHEPLTFDDSIQQELFGAVIFTFPPAPSSNAKTGPPPPAITTSAPIPIPFISHAPLARPLQSPPPPSEHRPNGVSSRSATKGKGRAVPSMVENDGNDSDDSDIIIIEPTVPTGAHASVQRRVSVDAKPVEQGVEQGMVGGEVDSRGGSAEESVGVMDECQGVVLDERDGRDERGVLSAAPAVADGTAPEVREVDQEPASTTIPTDAPQQDLKTSLPPINSERALSPEPAPTPIPPAPVVVEASVASPIAATVTPAPAPPLTDLPSNSTVEASSVLTRVRVLDGIISFEDWCEGLAKRKRREWSSGSMS